MVTGYLGTVGSMCRLSKPTLSPSLSLSVSLMPWRLKYFKKLFTLCYCYRHCCGSGSALIWLFWTRMQEHGNWPKVTNQPDLQPFKKAFVPMVCFMGYSITNKLNKIPIVHIPREPQCLCPSPNWDPPHSLSRKQVCPSPGIKEGGRERHTRLRVRKSQFGRLEKILSTLYTLWYYLLVHKIYFSCKNSTFCSG
jgi:hypothetical protein